MVKSWVSQIKPKLYCRGTKLVAFPSGTRPPAYALSAHTYSLVTYGKYIDILSFVLHNAAYAYGWACCLGLLSSTGSSRFAASKVSLRPASTSATSLPVRVATFLSPTWNNKDTEELPGQSETASFSLYCACLISTRCLQTYGFKFDIL